MCHGEFPDDFLANEQHAALYNKCLFGLDLLCDSGNYRGQPGEGLFTTMGLSIAYHLSSALKMNHLELSYLRLKTPGIRQAIYRTASRGSHKIICVGASGLMIPGHGFDRHLPAEIKKVMRDNPALDLTLAQPGINTKDAARLVQLSLEHAFNGPPAMDAEPAHQAECLEDTGVVLICAHDHDAINGMNSYTGNKYASLASMLSEQSKSAYREGGISASSSYMNDVASSLKEYGLPAVESGFMDFAIPGIEEAARKLIDSGATHIIAAGMPSLLHNHPFSVTGPSEAMERLRHAFPDTNIVYVKPDPVPIAQDIASLLMKKVLDAEVNGTSFRGCLRE